MWTRRFKRYMNDPYAEWPADRRRQADKLLRHGHPARAIIKLAKERRRDRPTTLFVVNCGASGSHWLTTMLADLEPFDDCGEVYLPADLLDEIGQWSASDRSAFLDCVHLAHVPTLEGRTARATLVNSAHRTGWRLAATMDRATVVLLVRDPVDIVVSRTWRKPAHRAEVAPDADDATFLDHNIGFVRGFFAGVGDHDLLVRYEDLRADTRGVLEDVCAVAGREVPRHEVDAVAARHQAGSATTNAYRGPTIEVPDDLRARAEHALVEVRRRFGYL